MNHLPRIGGEKTRVKKEKKKEMLQIKLSRVGDAHCSIWIIRCMSSSKHAVEHCRWFLSDNYNVLSRLD